MLRILLTDDEPLAVDAMEYMLQKKYGAALLTEKAYSGKEAVEACMNNRPDIVVMDINMPGLDGMKAILKIKEIYRDIHFLIVTALEYFDYAIESVKMEEIEDYLLKPLKKEIFLDAIERVRQKIEARKKAKKRELAMEEQMQLATAILEKNFIGFLCVEGYGKDYIAEYCGLFSITGKKAYVMMMEFEDQSRQGGANAIGAGILSVKYYKEYCNILKRSCDCIVGDIVRNRLVALVYGEFGLHIYEEKKEAVQIALKLLQRADQFGSHASVSIGRAYPVTEAKRSYHEALQASYRRLEYTTDTRIYHIDDIGEAEEGYIETDGEEKLIGCIMNGEQEAALTVVQDIYTHLRREGKDAELSRAKNCTLSIAARIFAECRRAENTYIQTLEQIIQEKSIWGLQKICGQYVSNVLRDIYADKEEKTSGIIEQANAYMAAHLSEKVSLEEIARHVNLSEYYFSRLYKSAAGKNCSDQLLCLRMEKAKRLIREKEYTVREIAELVGYPDPNYLSKVFKKYTGMTISEYKNGNYDL